MNWLEPFRRNARPMTGPAKQSRQHIQHWIASSLTLIAMTNEAYAAAAVTTCANSASRFDCER